MSAYLSIHALNGKIEARTTYTDGAPLILDVSDGRNTTQVTIFTGSQVLTSALVQAINTVTFIPPTEETNDYNRLAR